MKYWLLAPLDWGVTVLRHTLYWIPFWRRKRGLIQKRALALQLMVVRARYGMPVEIIRREA